MSLPWMLGNGVPLWKRGTGAIAYGAHGNPVYRTRRVLRASFAGTAFVNYSSVVTTGDEAYYSFSLPASFDMAVDPSVVTGRDWLDNIPHRWFWAGDLQTENVMATTDGRVVGTVSFRLFAYCDGFWDAGAPAPYTLYTRSMIFSVTGDVDAGDTLPRLASYCRYGSSATGAGDGMPHPYPVTMEAQTNNSYWNHGSGYSCTLTLL